MGIRRESERGRAPTKRQTVVCGRAHFACGSSVFVRPSPNLSTIPSMPRLDVGGFIRCVRLVNVIKFQTKNLILISKIWFDEI